MVKHWIMKTDTMAILNLLKTIFIFVPLTTSLCHFNEGNNCALYLPMGSVAYSQYQYFLNTIIGVSAENTCITYADIETAFLLASSSQRSSFPMPGDEWEPEDVKVSGEIYLETTKILVNQFDLNPEIIYHLLPHIDTTKTSLLNICPPFAKPLKCSPGRYRRIDGLCNNLHHPTWGATRAVFSRLIPPVYSDGLSAPRVSVVRGTSLPSARLVSATVHPDEGLHDHSISLLLIAWGQLMDHDFTLTATPLDPLNRNEPEECCDRPAALKNPYCFEIHIPPQDRFYNLFGARCMDFVRGFPGVRQNCKLGTREQFNILTGVIDGNTIYGGTDMAASELRLWEGGLLKEFHSFESFGLKPLLPLKNDLPDEGCTRANPSQRCFLAGEIRVNEQLILTCAHTIMMREHNRVARTLGSLNPHWRDERIYQETRHIVIAEIQHITFNEFLPELLGTEVMNHFGLTLSQSYWDGYSTEVNPSMTSAFVTSAFRFGHSLLPSTVDRWSPSFTFIESKRLSELIRQPFDLHRPGLLDEYFMGMMNQPAQSMDNGITQEVTNHLFQDPHERFGLDLVAFNLQRGREFGLPGYTAFRKFCNLPPVRSFDDLALYMTNISAARYKAVYKHVDDIDLWSAGVSEIPKAGAVIGPTFACVIAHQMARLRKGDRYWYELPNQPSSFTADQLHALKKVRFARILCDNTDKIELVQMQPMILHDYVKNPRVPCRSGIIPNLDLTPWIEIPTQKNFEIPTTFVTW